MTGKDIIKEVKAEWQERQRDKARKCLIALWDKMHEAQKCLDYATEQYEDALKQSIEDLAISWDMHQ